MIRKTTNRLSPEMSERSVAMVLDREGQHGTRCYAAQAQAAHRAATEARRAAEFDVTRQMTRAFFGDAEYLIFRDGRALRIWERATVFPKAGRRPNQTASDTRTDDATRDAQGLVPKE